MSDFIAYLDTSDVRPGRLEELKTAVAELAAFVELNEPRIISYRVYFSADGSTMSVLHIHPDMASLEFHMKVAGPKFPPMARFVVMRTIEIFGRPSEELVAQLEPRQASWAVEWSSFVTFTPASPALHATRVQGPARLPTSNRQDAAGMRPGCRQ
ncbi:hypothetical protein ABFP37_21060 [Burkholderia sp. RS01]|uniref:hypothetical protein n=1 Tax=unclassified Burkholderia TaxID=2613784 RepID=UPI0032188533